MLPNRRAARRVATHAMTRLLITTLIVSSIVVAPAAFAPPQRAAAASGEYLQSPPDGWTANGIGNKTDCPSNVTCDGNDATGTEGNFGGGSNNCGYTTLHSASRYNCVAFFGWSRASGVISFDITSIRLSMAFCTTGWAEPSWTSCGGGGTDTLYAIGLFNVPASGTCGTDADTEYVWYVVGSGGSPYDSGVFTLTTPLHVEAGGGACLRMVTNRTSGNKDASWVVYSWETWSSGTDFGSAKLGFVFYGAFSDDPVNIATGNFLHQAVDLALPGRLLGVSFARVYNSADVNSGPLGPGWTHSFNWRVTDAGATVDLRRGDGAVDRFTRNPDLTYSPPFGVFDSLVKNGDGTYTLTLTNQQAFAFSGSGALTRVSEPAGNHIDLTYTSGNLTTITDAVGRAVTLGYDGSNHLSQLQDSIGRKVTYAYDGSGRLITVTDKIGNASGQVPADHQWHYAYDGSSRHITTITDPDGRVRVTNSYDSQGRVFEQRDGLLALTTFAYTPGQTVLTDPRNHATTYTFDSSFRELSESIVVSGTTRTLSYTYDLAGNRDSVTDRNGKTTNFTFDARGNLLTTTDPQVDISIPRYVTTFQYDAKNNLYQITDARSFVTTHTFDPATNVKLSTSQQITTGPATYAVTKWEYGDGANPGMPTRVIAPRGNTTGTPNYTYSQSLTYDTAGNLTQRIDADASKTTFGSDGVGRQTTLIDADGYAAGGVPAEHTWTTVYDENDRVRQAIDPWNHAALTGYSASGDVLSVTDRNGNITSYVYDDNARLYTVGQKPDPVGQPTLVYTTVVTRDDNGNAIHVTQANGAVTDYAYDELNQLTSTTTHPSPSTPLTTSYVLDGNGNATTRTTADSVATTYTYDALGRLKTVAPGGITNVTYGYDPVSQRTSMVDATGSSSYQYDGLGRLTQAVQPNGTLSYGYDLDSNQTTLTYPAVGNVTSVFSPGGRLSTVTDWVTRQSTYTYTAAGRAKTLVLPNGMTTTYAYDRAQRLTSVVNARAGATISSHTYALDSEGNRTAIDELTNGISPSLKINTDAGTVVQDHPDIAIGADGASYLIWDDARLGNADIEFSRRATDGSGWSANVKVNTDTGTRIQQNPAIALDGSSNAYAVWQDERNGVGKADIYFSKRTSGATGTWSTPNLKVSDDPGASGGAVQRNPRIAGTSAGAETAVWVDLRSSQNNIYSSTLSSPWTAWTANKKVTDNTAAVKDFPDVAVGSDGTSYAVWQDSRSGNADIFFSTLTPGGSAWAANVKISDDSGSAAQTKPRIGIDGAGTLTVAWIDARTSPARVRAARKTTGGSWSGSVEVSPSPANAQSLALSVRSDGYAWATWGDTRAGASNSDIWGSRYDPYLNTWSPPLRLDDAPGTTTAQMNPTVAFSSSQTSQAMLSWRDNRLSANGDTQARSLDFLPGLTDHFALSYDGLNRLKSVTGPIAESFTFDAASNIATRTGPSQTDVYDAANRLTSDGTLSYTWSNADRLTNRAADIFGYDSLDRLISATVSSQPLEFDYNGDGLLQGQRICGPGETPGCPVPTIPFLWDPSSAVSRLLARGTTSSKIVYGLGPLYAVNSDGSTVTYVRDGSKNVRAELSSSGAINGAWRYRSYGQIALSSSLPAPSLFGFASQIGVAGLYYMRARWYDPAVGRFVTRDPMHGDPNNPVSLNAYPYATGNPISFIDPSGLDAESSDDWPDTPPCSPIPLPGKCSAQAQLSDDYVARLTVTIRPIGGLGLQISFAKQARKGKGAASKGAPGDPAGPPSPKDLDNLTKREAKTYAHKVKDDLGAGAADAVMIDRKTGQFYVVRPGSPHAEPDGFIGDLKGLLLGKP